MPEITSLPHHVLTTSGRAAIGLALEELGVGNGDTVLVPSYHCPTMVSPIVALGAVPRFFAMTADGLPDMSYLGSMDCSGVRALIAVHYFGVPRDFTSLRKFCDLHGIALIEDCAHAFFGRIGARAIGTTGDLAIASLTKFFPVSEGGCLASPRGPLRSARLGGQGWKATLRQFSNTLEEGARRGRFPPFSALISAAYSIANRLRGRRGVVLSPEGEVIEQLDPESAAPRFDADLAHRRPTAVTRLVVRRANRARIAELRRRNYRLLAQLLGDVRGLRPLESELPDDAVPYVFPVWVDEPERSYLALRRKGVPVFRWDILWPSVPELPNDVGLAWSHHVFQLACHQDLTEPNIRAMSDHVRMIIGGRV